MAEQRIIAAAGDLKVSISANPTAELEFEVQAYMPWGDEEEPFYGWQTLDAREVLELVESLDDWLELSGYGRKAA